MLTRNTMVPAANRKPQKRSKSLMAEFPSVSGERRRPRFPITQCYTRGSPKGIAGFYGQTEARPAAFSRFFLQLRGYSSLRRARRTGHSGAEEGVDRLNDGGRRAVPPGT